jgi:hypothetical protein
MAKEIIDGKKIDKKLKSRNPVIEFDKLKLFFGEPYEIDLEGVDGKITMRQPTIGDVVEIGEKKFYASLNAFITNTTSFRLQLWEQDIDWNDISDFDLFIMLVGTADKEVYNLFLPEINFANFGIFQKQLSDSEEKVNVLYDVENKIEINEQVYFHISQYLRNVFNIYPDEKLTKDAIMKKWFIEKDRRELRNREYKAKKGGDEDSGLISLVSACCNHPGFKYKSSELKELNVFQFYDSVKRLQIYESTVALNHGMYSGFCDLKGVPQENFNFMRSI